MCNTKLDSRSVIVTKHIVIVKSCGQKKGIALTTYNFAGSHWVWDRKLQNKSFLNYANENLMR